MRWRGRRGCRGRGEGLSVQFEDPGEIAYTFQLLSAQGTQGGNSIGKPCRKSGRKSGRKVYENWTFLLLSAQSQFNRPGRKIKLNLSICMNKKVMEASINPAKVAGMQLSINTCRNIFKTAEAEETNNRFNPFPKNLPKISPKK